MIDHEQFVLIHTSVTVLVSWIYHSYSRQHYLQASVNAAIVSNVIYLIVAYSIEGHLDKFWIIGLFAGFGVSFLIALAIGVLFWASPKSRDRVSGPSISDGDKWERKQGHSRFTGWSLL